MINFEWEMCSHGATGATLRHGGGGRLGGRARLFLVPVSTSQKRSNGGGGGGDGGVNKHLADPLRNGITAVLCSPLTVVVVVVVVDSGGAEEETFRSPPSVTQTNLGAAVRLSFSSEDTHNSHHHDENKK